MCILCVASRWSRRILAILPWLVFPLIMVWAFSQFLPPGFRFEVTSPRLACVLVLLFSLLWYEVLKPKLFSWRERRSALMRERKRIAALEAAKWRKEATRRCRNCMTAYKDQNPPSGRFMCSCCGHVSRRPVLDISNVALPDGGVGDRNIIVWDGKGVQKRRPWSLWGSEETSTAWVRNGCWEHDQCNAEKSYFSVVDIMVRIVGFVVLNVRKVFGSVGDESGGNGSRKGVSKKCDDVGSGNCSKSEKARRKAEEKRQARLEKEMLEEEERKQREEVARLVEERRKLREAEKSSEEHEKEELALKENKKKSEKDAKKKTEKTVKTPVKQTPEAVVPKKGSEFVSRSNGHGKGNLSLPYHDKSSGKFSSQPPQSSKGNSFWGSSLRTGYGSGEVKQGSVLGSPKQQSIDSAWNKISWGNVWGRPNAKQVAGNAAEVVGGNVDVGKLHLNGTGNAPWSSSPARVEQRPQLNTFGQQKSWQQVASNSSDSSSSQLSHGFSNKLDTQHSLTTGYPLQPTVFTSSPFGFGTPTPVAVIPSLFSNSTVVSVSDAELPNRSRFMQSSPKASSTLKDAYEDLSGVPDPVSLLGPVSEALYNFSSDIDTQSSSGTRKTCSSSSCSPISPPVNRPKSAASTVADLLPNDIIDFQSTTCEFPPPPASQPSSITEPWGLPSLNLDGSNISWDSKQQRQSEMSNVGKASNSFWTDGDVLLEKDKGFVEPFFPGHDQRDIQFPNAPSQCHSNASMERIWSNQGHYEPQLGCWNGSTGNAVHQVFMKSTSDGSDRPTNHFNPSENAPYNQHQNDLWPISQDADLRVQNNICMETGTASWSTVKSLTRPHVGGIFTTPGVQSVWSYN